MTKQVKGNKQICEATKLEKLQQAVREHVAEIDKIMNGPPSHARGRQIAQSLCRLERALLMEAEQPSVSTSPASGVIAGSSSPKRIEKPLSQAVSTARPKQPSKG